MRCAVYWDLEDFTWEGEERGVSLFRSGSRYDEGLLVVRQWLGTGVTSCDHFLCGRYAGGPWESAADFGEAGWGQGGGTLSGIHRLLIETFLGCRIDCAMVSAVISQSLSRNGLRTTMRGLLLRTVSSSVQDLTLVEGFWQHGPGRRNRKVGDADAENVGKISREIVTDCHELTPVDTQSTVGPE